MILIAAGLAGFAVLTLEILGVHLLAPWFGTTTLVWINQIGVVLLALAAGAWLGGARARNSPAPVKLAGALLLAGGVLVALALVLLPLVAGWLSPEGVLLDEAATLFFGGSLAVTLLFIAPPVFLLAMVAPLLIQARAAQRGAGRAAGEVSAVGTLGSLLGVFGSTFIGIPALGTTLSLLVSAALLAVAGLLLLARSRSATGLAGALLAAALIPTGAEGTAFDRLRTADPGATVNLPAGARVLETRETPYQRLRVIEFVKADPDGQPETGDEVTERWLQMNEGLDSFQSRWHSDTFWPGGYYDLFVLAPLYAEAGDEPVEIWMLGLGAGSALGPVAFGLQEQVWQATGVELDPGVSELAQRWMPLREPLGSRTIVLSGADARSVLRTAPANLDLILLDAYARQFEIPLHLATEEFFAEVRSHLREGGVFALNVGTSERAGDELGFLASIRAGLGSAFGEHVRAHRVPFSRNWVVFARAGRPLPPVDAIGPRLPAGTPVELAAALQPSAILDGVPSGVATRLTDERNPLAVAQAKQWWSSKE